MGPISAIIAHLQFCFPRILKKLSTLFCLGYTQFLHTNYFQYSFGKLTQRASHTDSHKQLLVTGKTALRTKTFKFS